MKRLFLVDGSNHAFRVHFALPTMHDATGFPTRALYGFTQLFGKMLRNYKPDYVVVSFDAGETFRHRMYADYKGHRPDMPEDLRQQWPMLAPLVEAFGYKTLAVPGYEADDVLGTLAAKFAADDVEVLLVTGDHDYYQLVNSNVRVLDDMKDEEYGPAEVTAKLGLGPDKVIDIKALAGDTSDNIPGVPGIGEKTAVKYLQKYGDLEAVLANWADVGGKRGDALRDHAADARLSRDLATICLNVPMDVTLEDLAPKGIQEVELREMFDKWGFGMMSRKLLPERKGISGELYRTVRDGVSLDLLERDLRALKRFAVEVDVYAGGLNGVAFAWGEGEAAYVPLKPITGLDLDADAARQRILAWLADANLHKVVHDAKRIYRLIDGIPRAADPGLSGELFPAKGHSSAVPARALAGVVSDTLLLDYVLSAHEGEHGLDKLASRHLAHTLVASAAGGLPFAPPLEEAAKGTCERAHIAWLVDRKLTECADEGSLHVLREIEIPLTPVLADMERAGIRVALDRLDGIRVDLDARLIDLERRCHEKAGKTFNVNSRHEVSEAIFGGDAFPTAASKKLKDGTWSTESGILEKITAGDDLPAAILEYRQLQKLKGTYVDKLPNWVAADGRIHTTFDQAVAATGRLSSRDPNLQNIPIRTFEGRRIRDCFVSEPGFVFVSADYSQIELRILAHLTEEDAMLASFEGGEDIHRRTASEVFNVPLEDVTSELRNAAKAINFGLMYGMSAFRLANELKITREQAQKYMDDYFGRMPKIAGWVEETKVAARKTGMVETMFGRKRVLVTMHSANHNERMAAEREAVNSRVQGTAADIIKIAMLRVSDMLRSERSAARMLLQVHDELLLEVPEAEVDNISERLVDAMEGAAVLRAKLRVNVANGLTWNDAHG